jgi:hypothetical protein
MLLHHSIVKQLAQRLPRLPTITPSITQHHLQIYLSTWGVPCDNPPRGIEGT